MTRLAIMTLKGTALAVTLVACVALGSARNVAAAADVKIASLDCDSEPQVVELTNSGDASQNLAGWELLSDPVADESYGLTSIGVLAPGSSVFIESGPGAEATFTWSNANTFRSGDPGDFARLVDDQGSTVSEVACAAGVQATSTPAPTPTTAPPAPTPTAAPVDGVPIGGGPPAADASALVTPLSAVVAGASLAGAGGLTLVALWLGGAVTALRRREPVVFEPPPPPPPPIPAAAPRRGQATSEPLILAMVVALCAAILLALILPSARRGK
jgi:hypothetical protein